MKKFIAILLSLVLLCSSASAMSDLTIVTKDPAQFSLSDCYDLIGEELFDELVSMAAVNNIDRSSFTYSQHLPSYRYYAPQLTALLYEYKAQKKDPYAVLFELGDTSLDLINLTEKLADLGYISAPTDIFTSDIELAIREIQLAAQQPMNGKITSIMSEALLSDFIPEYSVTLPYIVEIADHAMTSLDIASRDYFDLAKAMGANFDISKVPEEDRVNILYMYSDLMYDAEIHFPDHISTLNIQSVILNPYTTESLNTIYNLYGLFGCIFYCANYELSSDYLKYHNDIVK